MRTRLFLIAMIFTLSCPIIVLADSENPTADDQLRPARPGHLETASDQGTVSTTGPGAVSSELQSTPAGHLERPDGPAGDVSRDDLPRSPGYLRADPSFFTIQVNTDESGDNIVGDAANEPSITVDPTNRSKMVIGWRQFNTISNSFRRAGYGYSADGGTTWTFPGSIQPAIFRSDPVLDSDSHGNFYYNSLTSSGYDFSCQVFKSTDGGATWDAGTPAHGGDKQWMVIDRTGGPGDGNIYTHWTEYYSECYPHFFTRSIDGGLSYEDCISIPGSPYWGTCSVGPDGDLFICGDGFLVVRSSNAQNDDEDIVWDLTRVVSLGGSLTGGGGPNPGGLLGQVWIATDHSSGPTRGNVYLCSSVSPSGSPDPLDVMFARSTDGGQTWDSPVRVNDDPGTSAFQWFGTMSVAPNGRIDIIWLDTRDNPGSYDSSLYYSWSDDGGETWSADERLTDAFDPHLGWPQQDKMGDYFDMVSDEAGFHLAYAGTFNGEQDVYYGRYNHGLGLGRVVAGPGPDDDNPPLVRVFPPEQDASPEYEFSAYGADSYGVNVTCGDVNGDGIDEIITGAGPGAIYGPHVRGFTSNGTPLTGLSFLAYGTNKYGVNVAAADLDGDGTDELLTGAGPGAVFGPHVRAFSYDGFDVDPMPGISYFAYGTPKWGVNVAAGDIDGDGTDEILTGPGPGSVYGPHVRGWKVDGGSPSAMPAVSFMAYGTFKYGVNVSCGDIDGDGIDEIVTGAGPGAMFGPHVRGWNYDGDTMEALPGVNFMAWDTNLSSYGANVSARADLDGDGRSEIVVGPGPDPSVDGAVRVYQYDGSDTSLWFSLDASPEGWGHGTTVAAGSF